MNQQQGIVLFCVRCRKTSIVNGPHILCDDCRELLKTPEQKDKELGGRVGKKLGEDVGKMIRGER